MTTTHHVDVPEEIQRQLQTLQFRQMGLKPLPLVAAARNAVIDATALGNPIEIEAAQHVLAERLRKHREYDELTQEIDKLTTRLADAESRVRIERATAADQRLAAAQAEYRQASLTCARAFRRFIDAVRRSSNTPGAAIARVDYSLHLPSVTPISNQGTTGQAMSAGLLPFEQED